MTKVVNQFGYIPNPKAVQALLADCRHPIFAVSGADTIGEEKDTFLYRPLDIVLEKKGETWISRYQKHGTCVGQGAAHACDILSAVDIVDRGEPEQFKYLASAGACYAGGRVEIANQVGRWDGSNGAWSARFCREYGVLHRTDYGNGIDLRDEDTDENYGVKWAASWSGIPDVLEPIAREHPVQTVSLVRSWDELAGAIQSGYPVTIASDQGFRDTKDSQGFCKARGSWSHQMMVCGIRFGDRFGALVQNSWGNNWVSGPNFPTDMPPGSFWADRKVIEGILRQNDSWAFSGFVGFPKRKLNHLM